MKRGMGIGLAGAALAGALVMSGALAAGEPAGSGAPVRLAPAEARRMVKLMDDIYRTGVMTTHSMYVQDPGIPAAVTWGKQVLAQVNARGWPEGRIFAATDRPLNPENSPRDAFEKSAVEAFKRGKTRVEQQSAGDFRYASDIRITDQSCLKCHVRNKVGDLLGGISYRALLTGRTTERPR